MNIAFAREVGLPKYFFRRLILLFLYQIPRRVPRLQLPTGLVMNLPYGSFFARDVYVTGADVDWGSEALFGRYLDPGGDFLDVGANIGYYSVFMAPLVRSVFSFEPDPRNHAALDANAGEAGNILIQRMALSSHEGETHLKLGDESSVSRLATESGDADAGTVTVRTTTLDAFVRSQPDIRVTGIKVDTEGHELAILRSGIESIRRDQPLILAELMRWPGRGGEREFGEFMEFGNALGYTLYARTHCTAGCFRRARFRLIKLNNSETFSAHATKMLFLVPSRLLAAFETEEI